MACRCPNCDELIYSRRHPRCARCGVALPAELLLTGKAREIVDRELERSRAQAGGGESSGAADGFPLGLPDGSSDASGDCGG